MVSVLSLLFSCLISLVATVTYASFSWLETRTFTFYLDLAQSGAHLVAAVANFDERLMETSFADNRAYSRSLSLSSLLCLLVDRVLHSAVVGGPSVGVGEECERV